MDWFAGMPFIYSSFYSGASKNMTTIPDQDFRMFIILLFL
jgi:hypothetical protein